MIERIRFPVFHLPLDLASKLERLIPSSLNLEVGGSFFYKKIDDYTNRIEHIVDTKKGTILSDDPIVKMKWNTLTDKLKKVNQFKTANKNHLRSYFHTHPADSIAELSEGDKSSIKTRWQTDVPPYCFAFPPMAIIWYLQHLHKSRQQKAIFNLIAKQDESGQLDMNIFDYNFNKHPMFIA